MEPTEKEWAVRISKYGHRINVDKAIKDELVEFIQTEIYVYEIDDFTDRDLFFIFLEQFQGFTVESFKKIPIDLRSKL